MQTLMSRLSDTERQVISLGLDQHLTYIIHKWPLLADREHRADIISAITNLPVWVVLRIGKDTKVGLSPAEQGRFDTFLASL